MNTARKSEKPDVYKILFSVTITIIILAGAGYFTLAKNAATEDYVKEYVEDKLAVVYSLIEQNAKAIRDLGESAKLIHRDSKEINQKLTKVIAEFGAHMKQDD